MGARVLEAQRPAVIDDKPGPLVMAERLRVVVAARVYPQPPDRSRPGPIDRRPQQKRAEPAADEFRNEAEIAQFGFVRRRRVELEIAGRHPADIEHEDLGRLLLDLRRERRVVEQPALEPQPWRRRRSRTDSGRTKPCIARPASAPACRQRRRHRRRARLLAHFEIGDDVVEEGHRRALSLGAVEPAAHDRNRLLAIA